MKISVQNLSKKFINQEVLTDFSASFPSNEVSVIEGESGTGKSTLLNILALFESPDKGEVLYDDAVVSSLSSKEKQKLIREKIGYVYQDIRVFDELSVYENIKLALQFSKIPKNAYEQKIKEILEILNMTENSSKLCGVLSGGEKQRVAIARTIASEKEVIFADEPTGALDSSNTQVIIDLIKKINKNYGTTIIMVTHSTQVSIQFNFQYVLEKGALHEKNN